MRTGRVRTRAEFTALRERGVRSRRGPVRVTYLAAAGAAPAALPTSAPAVRIAFAVGKPVGNAVARNRLRRRLRAAIGELEPAPGDYLVSATAAAAALPYAALRDELGARLADVDAGRR
jgi:ribonuclease P protein component